MSDNTKEWHEDYARGWRDFEAGKNFNAPVSNAYEAGFVGARDAQARYSTAEPCRTVLRSPLTYRPQYQDLGGIKELTKLLEAAIDSADEALVHGDTVKEQLYRDSACRLASQIKELAISIAARMKESV